MRRRRRLASKLLARLHVCGTRRTRTVARLAGQPARVRSRNMCSVCCVSDHIMWRDRAARARSMHTRAQRCGKNYGALLRDSVETIKRVRGGAVRTETKRESARSCTAKQRSVERFYLFVFLVRINRDDETTRAMARSTIVRHHQICFFFYKYNHRVCTTIPYLSNTRTQILETLWKYWQTRREWPLKCGRIHC